MSSPTEARTRKELIDPALAKAGWDVNQDNPSMTILDPAIRERVEIIARRLLEGVMP